VDRNRKHYVSLHVYDSRTFRSLASTDRLARGGTAGLLLTDDDARNRRAALFVLPTGATTAVVVTCAHYTVYATMQSWTYDPVLNTLTWTSTLDTPLLGVIGVHHRLWAISGDCVVLMTAPTSWVSIYQVPVACALRGVRRFQTRALRTHQKPSPNRHQRSLRRGMRSLSRRLQLQQSLCPRRSQTSLCAMLSAANQGAFCWIATLPAHHWPSQCVPGGCGSVRERRMVAYIDCGCTVQLKA